MEAHEIRGEETGANDLMIEVKERREGEVFFCTLDQLEPGTSYQLQIESQRGDEVANVTLQTSESSQHHFSQNAFPSPPPGAAVKFSDLIYSPNH